MPGLPSPVDLHEISPFERERLPPELAAPDPGGARRRSRPSACSSPAPAPSARASASPTPNAAATSPRSSPASAACRWRSSSPRRGSGSSRRPRSTSASRAGSTSSARARPTCRSASARCAGAIAWSYDLLDPPCGACSSACRCSAAGFDLDLRRRPSRAARPSSASTPWTALAALVDQSLLAERRGRRRAAVHVPRADPRVRRGAAGEAGDAEEMRRAPRAPRTWRSRPACRPSSAATASGRRSTGSRPSMRTCAPRSRGATRAATPRSALGIVDAVWRFWQKRGHLTEARAQGRAARRAPLVRRDAARRSARGPTRSSAGSRTGRATSPGARPALRGGARDLAGRGRPGGDRERALQPLVLLHDGPHARRRGSDAPRGRIIDEAIEINRELGNDRGTADDLLGARDPALLRQRQRARGRGASRQARSSTAAGRDRTQEAWSLHQLGSARLKLGQLDGGPCRSCARASGCSRPRATTPR